MLVSELRIIVLVALDSPSDQPENSYPSLGVAVIFICVPSSYSPPSDETDPPSPAETESV